MYWFLYSVFKDYNVPFWFLKSAYYSVKKRNVTDAAIEAVEKAEKEKRWQYATWQMKVNLIYDMRHGGSGLYGITEERKENAIIAVLKSARSNEEFAKIVDRLWDAEYPREKVKIEKLLDGEQVGKFNDLKIKFDK